MAHTLIENKLVSEFKIKLRFKGWFDPTTPTANWKKWFSRDNLQNSVYPYTELDITFPPLKNSDTHVLLYTNNQYTCSHKDDELKIYNMDVNPVNFRYILSHLPQENKYKLFVPKTYQSDIQPCTPTVLNNFKKMLLNSLSDGNFCFSQTDGNTLLIQLKFDESSPEDMIWIASNLALSDNLSSCFKEIKSVGYTGNYDINDSKMLQNAIKNGDFKTISNSILSHSIAFNNDLAMFFCFREDVIHLTIKTQALESTNAINNLFNTIHSIVVGLGRILDKNEIEGISRSNFIKGIEGATGTETPFGSTKYQRTLQHISNGLEIALDTKDETALVIILNQMPNDESILKLLKRYTSNDIIPIKQALKDGNKIPQYVIDVLYKMNALMFVDYASEEAIRNTTEIQMLESISEYKYAFFEDDSLIRFYEYGPDFMKKNNKINKYLVLHDKECFNYAFKYLDKKNADTVIKSLFTEFPVHKLVKMIEDIPSTYKFATLEHEVVDSILNALRINTDESAKILDLNNKNFLLALVARDKHYVLSNHYSRGYEESIVQRLVDEGYISEEFMKNIKKFQEPEISKWLYTGNGTKGFEEKIDSFFQKE